MKVKVHPQVSFDKNQQKEYDDWYAKSGDDLGLGQV